MLNARAFPAFLFFLASFSQAEDLPNLLQCLPLPWLRVLAEPASQWSSFSNTPLLFPNYLPTLVEGLAQSLPEQALSAVTWVALLSLVEAY